MTQTNYTIIFSDLLLGPAHSPSPLSGHEGGLLLLHLTLAQPGCAALLELLPNGFLLLVLPLPLQRRPPEGGPPEKAEEEDQQQEQIPHLGPGNVRKLGQS